MIDSGVIDPDDPIELVDGQIWELVRPQSSRHAVVVHRVRDALHAAAATDSHVRMQVPLALGDHSQPEPDVAIVQGRLEDYLEDHPSTARLVVEVSDSSLAVDRETKRGLYAREGVPEYWIVNLDDEQIEVHADSDGRESRTRRVLRRGDRCSPEEPGGSALASAIEVTALLPS